jgi:lipoprotein NlpI
LERGVIFYKLGVIDGAKTDFLESNKLYPTEKATLYLGKIALLEGNYEKAVRYFNQTPETGANYRAAAQMLAALRAQKSKN